MSEHGGKREGSGRKPGSKNRANRELRDAAQAYTTNALQTLASIMSDNDSPAASRVAAANAILDRAAGRAMNFIEADFDIGTMEPTDALAAIGSAVSSGDISPQEAAQLSAIVEGRIKVVEMAEIEQRLTELEANR